MPNKRTPKSPYPSRYGRSRWVSAPQWLAELMCERRARAEKRTLPPEFWKRDEFWAGVYRQQVAAASRLVRRLDPQGTGSGAKALSLFLRSERGKTCYSLMGAWLVPLLEAAHRAVAFRMEQAPAPETPPQAEPSPPPAPERHREAFVPRQSLKSKLEGL